MFMLHELEDTGMCMDMCEVDADMDTAMDTDNEKDTVNQGLHIGTKRLMPFPT
jgi:hypothetical protein